VIFLLDTGILGKLCHPSAVENVPVANWLRSVLGTGDRVVVPEIADYELRRKLLHLARKNGEDEAQKTRRLDELARRFEFAHVTEEDWRAAATLWADSRIQGFPTADPKALDGDTILAAQATRLGGRVVTTNPRHLSRLGVDVMVPGAPES
jgi:predicted nucleic acid-binding protein